MEDDVLKTELYNPERPYRISVYCWFWQSSRMIIEVLSLFSNQGLSTPMVETERLYFGLKTRIVFSRKEIEL